MTMVNTDCFKHVGASAPSPLPPSSWENKKYMHFDQIVIKPNIYTAPSDLRFLLYWLSFIVRLLPRSGFEGAPGRVLLGPIN